MTLKTINKIQNEKGFHNLKQYSKNIPPFAMNNLTIENGEEVAVLIRDLKAEAINWIKELEKGDMRDFCMECGRFFNDIEAKCNHSNDKYLYEAMYEDTDIDAVIKFIKHFFCISEEDLK